MEQIMLPLLFPYNTMGRILKDPWLEIMWK